MPCRGLRKERYPLHAMIARNKLAVDADAGTEPPPPGRNRRNVVRVLVSYRTFSRGWAFRPNRTAVMFGLKSPRHISTLPGAALPPMTNGTARRCRCPSWGSDSSGTESSIRRAVLTIGTCWAIGSYIDTRSAAAATAVCGERRDILAGSTYTVRADRENGVAAVPIRSMVRV
jgi:hypothetical protein